MEVDDFSSRKKLKSDSSWISSGLPKSAVVTVADRVKRRRCKKNVSFLEEACSVVPVVPPAVVCTGGCSASSEAVEVEEVVKERSDAFASIHERFVIDFPRWEKVIKDQVGDPQVFEITSQELRKITERVTTLVDAVGSCHVCLVEYNKFDKLISLIVDQYDDDNSEFADGDG